MRRILIITMCAMVLCMGLILISCFDDDEPECDPGDMRCHNDVSQMCSSKEKWEDYQDCGAIGESCYSSAAQCSGYSDISCCR